MDILDVIAQMEKYGTLVAFAPHYYNSDNTVVVVKLHKMLGYDIQYAVLIWDSVDRTDKWWHSSHSWLDAAESFQNITQ